MLVVLWYSFTLCNFFFFWRRWICFFSDLWDYWWNCLCGISGSILWSKNFSQNFNLFCFWNRHLAAAVTATDAARNITQADDIAALCIHLFNLGYFIEWRQNMKTCKFWFAFEDKEGDEQGLYFYTIFYKMKQILFFFQIWLFSYLPCLLIYNVLFTMLYFIWCLEKSSI